MFTHLIELIILSCIAYFLINKLISILGNVNEEDSSRRSHFKSYFGEPGRLKDITGTATSETSYQNSSSNKYKLNYLEQNEMVVSENANHIITEFNHLKKKLPSFDSIKFYNIATDVIKMVVKAVQENDNETISLLLDKRFIEKFNKISTKYTNLTIIDPKLTFKISDIYSFGNNVFIKLLVELPFNKYKEEWVFTKNLSLSSPEWYLSNIEEII